MFRALAFWLLAGLLLLPAAVAANPPARAFSGVIGDTMCGAHHQMAGMSAAECTRKCVAMGGHFALLAGRHVYRLEAGSHAAAIGKLAGKRAVVRGTLHDGAIEVVSIAAAAS
ncbi:MAG: hypothetical protein ACRD2H_05605 [Terriglobales bacterium]